MTESKQAPERLVSEPGLSPENLRAIEELEAACVAVDGGRLKLEWGTLKSRSPEQRNDFLWMGPGGALGFLGIYRFGSGPAELCGMVHPSVRRRGIFSSLYKAATAELVSREVHEALLVVDRTYAAGTAFARFVGGTIEHSEHRMRLTREPAQSNSDPLVAVREIAPADGAFLISCLAEAFEQPAERFVDADYDAFTKRFPGTYIIEYANERVGTVRVDRHEQVAGIYGFAVLPSFQGRGIGRQVLSDLARELAAEGMNRVELEVACTNDAALHLYLSSGFDVLGTEDYYAVSLRPATP